ncbi:MAG: S-layer protein [Methanoregula sp.]|uniref:COG1361 S-layer family protein n=1 Tax=Methanoregula sp. TaxID=2052170 RepID=UPI003D0CF83C
MSEIIGEKAEKLRSVPTCKVQGTCAAGSRRGYVCLCLAAVAVILLAAPALADDTGSRYMAGSPELSAHIAGTNQFSPGDDLNVPIAIENSGTNQFKIVKSTIIDPGDLSNTAKQLTVSLGAADAPLLVKSDPQLVGDLGASSSVTATFHITINQDAPAGTYNLPVSLNYTYLYAANQYGTDTLSYTYKTVNQNVTVPIEIKSDVQITVMSVNTQDLNVGNEGYVTLSLRNTGYEDGRNAVMMIQQPAQSPLSPTEGSFFIGDFPVGAVANCTFRLMVSDDAQQKTYPLDVLVNYKNSDGVYVNSASETIGVPVGGKIQFIVTPVTATMSPGAKSVITVTFRNTGSATAYNAQARISAVDPFTSNDDTAFLGTMAPGDIRQASYEVALDSGATVKEYGLDSEVMYRDSLDNEITSDPLKVNVQVVPSRTIVNVLGLPGLLGLIVVIGILASLGYFVYSRRVRNQ